MKKIMPIIITLVVIALVVMIIFSLDFTKKNITYGVTFSEQYAKDELGLDWQKAYLAILDDLKVTNIRLSAYWNHNEPYDDQYNFGDLDWQISEASKREVKIVLGVGRKLPRWPECHDPDWIKNLSSTDTQKKQLEFIDTVINRYQNNKNIVMWQVENEPFLKLFGECPPLDKNFLAQEIALVKKLDTRPILITDSGELSSWIPAAKTPADFLGTTLYRVVYDAGIGYWRWPLPAAFYATKAWYVKTFWHKKFIIAELQAESWHRNSINLSLMSQAEHDQSMSLKQLQKNIRFAKKTGATEIYLWGVEWWYFMKEKQSNDTYWQEAKKLWVK